MRAALVRLLRRGMTREQRLLQIAEELSGEVEAISLLRRGGGKESNGEYAALANIESLALHVTYRAPWERDDA